MKKKFNFNLEYVFFYVSCRRICSLFNVFSTPSMHSDTQSGSCSLNCEMKQTLENYCIQHTQDLGAYT